MMPYPLLLATLLLLVSCAPSSVELSPQGEIVQLMQEDLLPPNCGSLGSLKSVALAGEHNAYRQALKRTRNKAGLLNATHIRVERTEAHAMATTLYATALRCVPQEDTPQPDPDKLIILD
jgi:hypothetical protein